MVVVSTKNRTMAKVVDLNGGHASYLSHLVINEPCEGFIVPGPGTIEAISLGVLTEDRSVPFWVKLWTEDKDGFLHGSKPLIETLFEGMMYSGSMVKLGLVFEESVAYLSVQQAPGLDKGTTPWPDASKEYDIHGNPLLPEEPTDWAWKAWKLGLVSEEPTYNGPVTQEACIYCGVSEGYRHNTNCVSLLTKAELAKKLKEDYDPDDIMGDDDTDSEDRWADEEDQERADELEDPYVTEFRRADW